MSASASITYGGVIDLLCVWIKICLVLMLFDFNNVAYVPRRGGNHELLCRMMALVLLGRSGSGS